MEKAIQSIETCVFVYNNLRGKIFSSLESPATFDESFKVTSGPFFDPNFNLLSCELDNFKFKVYLDIILNQIKIAILL